MTAWPPDRTLRTVVADTLGRTRVRISGMRCIASWGELRERLGGPQAILCLGNGPSSEGSGVEAARFDCLFRVNWIWNERAVHCAPDVVFTADADAPPASSAPIICFPSREDASRILAGYPGRQSGERLEYMVFPELPSAFTERSWSHRPTNGALMVAAAVLLRPSRLIVAGIDLYLHPDGKYPGSTAEPNRYDEIHHRDVDIAFIRAALGQFDGDIAILSEQLQRALS